VPYFISFPVLSLIIACNFLDADSFRIIKNIQALSIFKQNRLSQKLSKLRVALVGAEADISDQAMKQL
jgi:hypothetical protein